MALMGNAAVARRDAPQSARGQPGTGGVRNTVHGSLAATREERYAFITEWYDPTASVLQSYQLFYYPRDGSVEMFDMKKQQKFLKRIKYDAIDLKDLFVGNRVNVFSRQLNLIEYGDDYTASKVGCKKEKTLALIKPGEIIRLGEILEVIYASKMIVTKAKMVTLTWSQAADFYAEHQLKPFFNTSVQFLSSGPVVVMELMGDDAVSVWKRFVWEAEMALAKEEQATQVGADGIRNFGHGSHSLAAAAKELEFFFSSAIGCSLPNTATYADCTCCIIKPHAIAEGLTGKILNSIADGGYKVSALQMFSLDRASAEEFLEVYKGVVSEYPGMVNELSSGPCMALEILETNKDKCFRDFCGPADPEISRLLRPNTLRALYGKDKVKNAVHCTDLPEDGVLEVEYFFKILDG